MKPNNIIKYLLLIIIGVSLSICWSNKGYAEEKVQEHKDNQITAGYDGGFFIKSQDDNFKLSIGGVLQSQLEVFSDSSRPSEFLMRRARLEFEGELYNKFEFAMEPSFRIDEYGMEEIYLAYNLSPELQIKTGLPKAPFSLEEIIPRKHIDFAEHSMVNQFAPAEDAGILVLGTISDGLLEYATGVVNGSGEHDTTTNKDWVGRLVVHPFHNKENKSLKGLQFGGACTIGHQNADISGNKIENEGGKEIVEFSSTPAVTMKGNRTRLGGEVAWLAGPLAVMGEYVSIENDLVLGVNRKSVSNNVWYISASYVLTGEDKTFKGVTPDKPFDPSKGQWGAWQIALRYTQLNLDKDLTDFNFTIPGNSTTKVSASTVGLNWYLFKNIRIRTDFISNTYADPISVSGENLSKENEMIMQFQINF
jgi:phosphate-selective porin OprO/OprP